MPSPHKKSFAAEQLARQKRINPVTWVLVGIVIVAVIAGGYTIYQRSVQKQVETEVRQIKSIAILAFDDMSQDKDQEYFCDGIVEEIINALSHVDGLRVIARNSAFSFKGLHPDIREVGEKLDVEYVLEGSVRKSDDELRIAAQLIKVSDHSHIWSNIYERNLEDVFDIQEEIAKVVTQELQVTLLEKDKVTIEKRYTDDTEAYDLYLWGSYYARKYDYKKAIEYYHRALEKDPNFVLGYTGVSNSYVGLGFFGIMPPQAAYPEAKKYIRKALDIDETNADAHAALAAITWSWDMNFTEAESTFKRALELNPGSAGAHLNYVWCIEKMGRFDEALGELKRARELDPFNLQIYATAVSLNLAAGKNMEALKQLHKAIEIDANCVFKNIFMGMILCHQSKYIEAIEALLKEKEDSEYYYMSKAYLAYIYGISGDRDKAEKILQYLINFKKDNYLDSTWIATVYAGLGETDKAFEWLENAYKERDSFLLYIKMRQLWSPIRSDPRYKALLKKMGLPE